MISSFLTLDHDLCNMFGLYFQDPDETAGDDEHLSEYGEGDLEVDGEDEDGEVDDADGDDVEGDDVEGDDGEGDAEGPNVQPLDSSDEERAPDDDDQLDDTIESDGESVTVDDEREEGDGQVISIISLCWFDPY